MGALDKALPYRLLYERIYPRRRPCAVAAATSMRRLSDVAKKKGKVKKPKKDEKKGA